jgi:transcriptional regulator with XRE-family HTH domain
MTQLQVPQARRLRAELRSARARAGLTQRDVAEAMEWSLPKLIRIESASVGISTADLRALLHHYGVVEPAEVERLVNLARAGKEQRSWELVDPVPGGDLAAVPGIPRMEEEARNS